ncbi:MAG: twin-arginine translocation signal domain-containing protein, partial [Gemmatimonadota bacterium]
MVTRRRFLGAIGLPAAAAAGGAMLPARLEALSPGTDTRARLEELSATPGEASRIARDEDFWAEVQNAFTVDRSLVNLNNGGVSPTPGHVLE